MHVIHGPFTAIERALFDAPADRERFAPARVVAPSARMVRHLKVAAAGRSPVGANLSGCTPTYDVAAALSLALRALMGDNWPVARNSAVGDDWSRMNRHDGVGE